MLLLEANSPRGFAYREDYLFSFCLHLRVSDIWSCWLAADGSSVWSADPAGRMHGSHTNDRHALRVWCTTCYGSSHDRAALGAQSSCVYLWEGAFPPSDSTCAFSIIFAQILFWSCGNNIIFTCEESMYNVVHVAICVFDAKK